jgi:hypothetical protein
MLDRLWRIEDRLLTLETRFSALEKSRCAGAQGMEVKISAASTERRSFAFRLGIGPPLRRNQSTLDEMRDPFWPELRRVEEVWGARLKHVEGSEKLSTHVDQLEENESRAWKAIGALAKKQEKLDDALVVLLEAQAKTEERFQEPGKEMKNGFREMRERFRETDARIAALTLSDWNTFTSIHRARPQFAPK